MTHKKTDEGYPIFRSYLEEENDKPYYSMNTLSFYYEDMARKQKLIEDLAKAIAGYDQTLTGNLAAIEQQVAERFEQWDEKLKTFDGSVMDLLQEWVDDGTMDHIVDSSIVDRKLEPLTTQLAETETELIRTKQRLLSTTRSDTYLFDLDVNEAVSVKKSNYLNIPTYVEKNDELVHPSILYFPEKWNGWHYWMAMTPYTDGSILWENPSIVVSQNGLDWVVPNGLVNPVFDKPSDGYYADTNIFLDPDGKTMHMVWKYASTQKVLYLSSTRDGVTWGSKVPILTTAEEEISPSVMWDGTQYVMWTVNVSNGIANLRKRTSPDLISGWSSFSNCILNNNPTGRTIWHMDINKFQNQYHLVGSFGDIGGGRGSLYFAKSDDGDNWQIGDSPLLSFDIAGTHWDRVLYKPAIVPKMKNNEFYYGLWYGSSLPFYVGYTEITFDKKKIKKEIKEDILLGINKIEPVLLADTFNRADSILELGTSSTGQAWSNTINKLGIINGKAYSPDGVNARAIINAGVSDFYAEVELAEVGRSGWLMFRYVTATNLWRIGFDGDQMVLERISDGVRTTMFTKGKPKAKDVLGVECKGDSITIFVNRKVVGKISSESHRTGTILGLNCDNSITMFDNFLVKSVF